MNSSEEYLDNLLKSLLNADETEESSASTQSAEEVNGAEASLSDNISSGEYNKAMSTDDIEAMFASMGQNVSSEESDILENAPGEELTSEEDDILNEMALNASILPEELTSDESSQSDERVLDESMLPEENGLPDEMALDESLLPGEMALEESGLPEETASDESGLRDELALNESMLPEELALDESSLPEELALDEGSLPEELALDEGSLPEELALDESSLPEELALDESSFPDELVLDESMLPEELALDESMLPKETLTEDNTIDELDDFALDESRLPDELALDESMLPEEMSSDDFALEESGEEESGSDDLSLDDLGLDDLGFGMSEQGETDMMEEASSMTEEDIDRLLNGDLLPDDKNDQDIDVSDDSDLSALLAGMGDDEDLSEINDLLEKSDRGIAADDDMLAMLGGAAGNGEGDDEDFNFFGSEETAEGEPENIREITPEELEERENLKSKKQKKKADKEQKKKEKLAKKAARKAAKKGTDQEEAAEAGEDELNSLLGSMTEAEDKPKKQGIFSRFLAFLLEEDEEEDDLLDDADDLGDTGAMIGNISEENKELLAELKAEDKMNAKKKGKADKKGKKKKGKKGDETPAEGEEAEVKPKKPKKEKKKKQKSEDDELKVPEKKLSKKKVMSVFLFCATIAACIVVVTMLLPEQMEKQEARVAFDHGQYEQVYEQLYGRKLSEEDEALLQKSSVVLQVKRKLNSYENYMKIDMPLEALNALLEGVNRYQNLRDDAELYRVSGEVEDIYGQILDALANQYGLSEADALDILGSGDNVTYSQRLRSIVYGDTLDSGNGDMPEVKQDVLPEEEEIIDRLQNADETEEPESNEIL